MLTTSAIDTDSSRPRPELGDIGTICVLGWGLKGDLFIRIPLIEALKERFPQARITVVVDPGNVIVLENHPYEVKQGQTKTHCLSAKPLTEEAPLQNSLFLQTRYTKETI